jgi:hypothetical protein
LDIERAMQETERNVGRKEHERRRIGWKEEVNAERKTDIYTSRLIDC